MTNKERQCDALVQQIAVLTRSQWSNYPAECGHHIIGRANYLWRWRLINIAPLTIEEHAMCHAGLLDPLAQWQKNFKFVNKNKLLTHYLTNSNMTRDEFVNESLVYLRQVKDDIEHGRVTWDDVIKKEMEKYGTEKITD